MCQWWQLLQAAKHPWTQSRSATVKVTMVLLPFNQWQFSVPGETGNSLFFQRCLQPFYLSRSATPTQSSLIVLCWLPVLSQFGLCVQPSNKIMKHRGLWTRGKRVLDISLGEEVQPPHTLTPVEDKNRRFSSLFKTEFWFLIPCLWHLVWNDVQCVRQ